MYVAYRAFRGVVVSLGIVMAPYFFFEWICSAIFRIENEGSYVMAGIIWTIYIFLLIQEYSDEFERIRRKVRDECHEEFDHIYGK